MDDKKEISLNMAFITSLLLVFLFALLLNALFTSRNRIGNYLRFFILAWMNILLTVQITSVFHSLNLIPFLSLQVLLVLVAWLIWRFRASPSILGPYKPFSIHLPPFRRYPILYIFSVVVGLVYLACAIEIIYIPQNNYDSLTYHLARVGFWLQHQSLAVWDTPNFRQAAFPPNAEIGVLWTTLMTGSDKFSGFIQWIAFIVCGIAIYGSARLLGASRSQSFFACLVWSSFPQILLQSTTTQNDLVIAAFIMSSLFFIISGIKAHHQIDWLTSGISFGMAVGSKTSIFFIIPPLVVVVIMWFLSMNKDHRKDWLIWAVACFFGIILFGSMVYIQNFVAYRSLLGPPSDTEITLGPTLSRLTMAGENILLYSYQALDPTGLPSGLANGLIDLKAAITQRIFRRISFTNDVGKYSIQQILYLPPRVHEDIAWFGPNSVFVLFPALLIQFWFGLKNRNFEQLALCILGVGFFVTLSFLIGWTPFRSRYLVIGFTITAPLMAFLYKPRLAIYTGLAAIIGIWILGYTVLNNESKPLIGKNSIWGKDQITLRTMNMPIMASVLRTVDKQVPENSRLALKMGENGPDYLFFGSHFQRTLIQVDELVNYKNIASLKNVNADYFIVGPRQHFFSITPQGLDRLAEIDNLSIYRVDPKKIGMQTEIKSTAYQESDPQKLVYIVPELANTVGFIELWTGAWPVEQDGGSGFYWFGHGEPQGLGISLWSDKDMIVQLGMEVAPGPSLDDPHRSLAVVTFDAQGHRNTFIREFTISTALHVPIQLHEGINEVGMYVLETANIQQLPNGDLRPLLVGLDSVTLSPQP